MTERWQINWREDVTGFRTATLLTKQEGEADSRAQLVSVRALLAPNRESRAETSLDFRRIWRPQAPQQLAERFANHLHRLLLFLLLYHMAHLFGGLRRLALGHWVLDISCGKTLDSGCAVQ